MSGRSSSLAVEWIGSSLWTEPRGPEPSRDVSVTCMATGNIGTVGKFYDCTVCSSDFSFCNMNVDRGLHLHGGELFACYHKQWSSGCYHKQCSSGALQACSQSTSICNNTSWKRSVLVGLSVGRRWLWVFRLHPVLAFYLNWVSSHLASSLGILKRYSEKVSLYCMNNYRE